MPLIITIAATGVDELSERFLSLGEPDSEVRENIYLEVLTQLGKQMTPRLTEATPLGATGRLRRDTRFTVTSQPDLQTDEVVYTLKLIQDSRKRNYLYRPVVVRGRQTGGRWPRPGDLLPWVRTKFGVSGKEAISASFALARHIGLKGTKANLYPFEVVDGSQDLLIDASNLLSSTIVVTLTDI